MIRIATIDDIPEVMRLLVGHHAENGWYPLSQEKVANTVLHLLENRHPYGPLIVAESAEGLAGLVGLVEIIPFYTDDGTILVDQFLYVDPPARGKKVFQALADATAEEGIRRGLPVVITILNPARAKRKGRVASVEGYIPMGSRIRLA